MICAIYDIRRIDCILFEFGKNDPVMIDMLQVHRLRDISVFPGDQPDRSAMRSTTGKTNMSQATLIVGLDGSDAGKRALDFAKVRARLIGDCRIVLVYVIEWSPFSFQTAEENEKRHARREEELQLAHERVLGPAVKQAEAEGCLVEGVVRHGDVAEILENLAKKHEASQIIVGRMGERNMKERLFGGVTGRLVAASSVPITVIP
jgi:nucleotide-binding universal stress UspA family protein